MHPRSAMLRPHTLRTTLLALSLLMSGSALAQVPIAGWEMDEGSGDRIFDCTGTGHDSSNPISATYISPGYDGTGSALNFNGEGQWVKIGGMSGLEPPIVTIVAYIRTPDPGHGSPVSYLLTKNPHGNQGPSYGLSVFENINDNLRFNILVAGSGSGTGSVSIVGTTWKQVVASFDGSTARLYYDGVLASSTPLSGPIDYSAAPNDNGLAIGQYQNGGYWKGDVDSMRIYGQVLTPDEIPVECYPGFATVPLLVGSLMGGKEVPGGIDYEFPVGTSGTISANYIPVGLAEFAELAQILVDPGTINFAIPTDPAFFWDVSFSGVIPEPDPIILTFGYDDQGVSDERTLRIFHFDGMSWLPLPTFDQNFAANWIKVKAHSLSPLALGIGPPAVPSLPTFKLWMGIAIVVVGITQLRRSRLRN